VPALLYVFGMAVSIFVLSLIAALAAIVFANAAEDAKQTRRARLALIAIGVLWALHVLWPQGLVPLWAKGKRRESFVVGV